MSRFPILPTFPALGLIAVLVAAILLAVSQSTGSVHAATLNVDGADVGCDDVAGTPYCTIGAAVADADAGDVINTFPGTYAESVDLGTMNTPGDITLTTVDGSGTPTPGTATVSPSSGIAVGAFSPDFPGDIGIFGLTVVSNSWGMDLRATGSVTLVDVTANGHGKDGVNIGADGAVTISDSTANDNTDEGFQIVRAAALTIIDSIANDNGSDGFDIVASGDVTITGGTANTNDDDGVDIDAAASVTIDNFTADGNGDFQEGDGVGYDIDVKGDVTITDSSANGNAEDGFKPSSDGSIVICGGTAIENVEDGIDMEEDDGTLVNARVTNSVVQDNGAEGIDFDTSSLKDIGTFRANGNNISGNGTGLELDGAVTVNATGNWWGDASGPTHPSNTGGSGDAVEDLANNASGTVDFDPFLTSPSADAGTCEPPPEPTPTPTSAPAVLAATATPTPAALPESGGVPSQGGSSTIPGLLAIAGALAVMSAGGLWLAYQRRRIR